MVEFTMGDGDDEGVTLVLQAVTGSPQAVVPGSVVVEAGCGHICWITANNMTRIITAPDTTFTVCGDCLTLEPGDEVVTSRRTLAELQAHLVQVHPELADEVVLRAWLAASGIDVHDDEETE